MRACLVVAALTAAVLASSPAFAAVDFTFSFANVIGDVAGVVSGEIFGLTDNTTSARDRHSPHQLFPAALGLQAGPLDVFTDAPFSVRVPVANSFTVFTDRSPTQLSSIRLDMAALRSNSLSITDPSIILTGQTEQLAWLSGRDSSHYVHASCALRRFGTTFGYPGSVGLDQSRYGVPDAWWNFREAVKISLPSAAAGGLQVPLGSARAELVSKETDELSRQTDQKTVKNMLAVNAASVMAVNAGKATNPSA